jgi:hypothetical protein
MNVLLGQGGPDTVLTEEVLKLICKRFGKGLMTSFKLRNGQR